MRIAAPGVRGNRVKPPGFELRMAFEKRRRALYPKLRSENSRVAIRALEEWEEYESWLEPSPNTEVRRWIKEGERRHVENALTRAGFSDNYARSMSRKAPSQGELRPGRPKTKLDDAYRGYDLHFLESKTWRQITLEVRGSCRDRNCKMYCSECNDVMRSTEATRRVGERCKKCDYPLRPTARKNEVCYKCADAMADLVTRLSAFASSKGINSPALAHK